jgi:hypothetical protein
VNPGAPCHLREDERLLVLAAADASGPAAEWWRAWLRERPLDDIEPDSFVILPAVSKQLEREPGDHPEAGRLRGVYRYAWAQNQVTFRDLATVFQALVSAGVPVVAHRGLPIVARYLGDPAAIIVDQVDLLIPPADLDRAVDALADRGWKPVGAMPPAAVRPAFQSLALESPDRRRVVLHWRCLPLGCPERLERGVLDRAVRWELQGVELCIPDPTDQALIALVRIGTLMQHECARWTLESLAIGASGIDAGELAMRLEASGTDPSEGPGLPTLEALEQGGPGSVPAAKSGRTQPGPDRPRAANPLIRLLRALPRTWRRYQAVCAASARAATPWGFVRFVPAYYRHAWEVWGDVGLTRSAMNRVLRTPEHSGVRPT